MKVMTGRVAGGKVEVETDLPDGTAVAILAAGDTGFQLTAEEEEELVVAYEEIRRGNYVDGEELLRELRELYG